MSTFRPDADAWAARGYAVSATVPEADHGLVVLPRSRALARGRIAQAAALVGTVAVDGQKTDGVEAVSREVRGRTGDLTVISRDHGKLFWFDSAGIDFADWALSGPQPGPDGFVTQPGTFSEARVDPGSALLAAALPRKLPAHVVDLGAGWGYLTRAILDRDGVERVDAVEAESLALDCARINAADPRVAFHWADATGFRPDAAPGAVVMNPPFHESRAGDPGLGRAFIAAAAAMLAPSGRLWCVANRHLPYESELKRRFREVEELPGTPAFKLLAASRPRPADRLA